MKKIIASILLLTLSILLFMPTTQAWEDPTEYITVNSYQDIPTDISSDNRVVYYRNLSPDVIFFYPHDDVDAFSNTPYYLRFKDNAVYNKINAATQIAYLQAHPGATDYASAYVMLYESQNPVEVMAGHHYFNTFTIDGVFKIYFRVIPLSTSAAIDNPYTVVVTLTLADLYFSGEEPSEGIAGAWFNPIGNRDYIYFRFNSKANPGDEYESSETSAIDHYTDFTSQDNIVQAFDHTVYLAGTKNALTIVERDEGGQENQVFFGTVSNVRIKYVLGTDTDGFEIYNGSKLIYYFENPYYDMEDLKSIKMYLTTIQTVTAATPADLPVTTGSIQSETGTIGIVNLKNVNLSTHQVDFEIIYNSISYTYSNIIEDIGFLVDKDVTSAYYYTKDGDRYIYFDYSVTTQPMLLASSPTVKWNGFAIYNLTESTVTLTEKLVVLTYFDKEEANNIYAYFYIPNVIMDKLLAVTLEFDYRYYRTGFPDFWNKYPMETRHDTVHLENGEFTETLPEWTLQAYKYVAAATIIGSMIPLVRWPVLILGTMYLSANYINNEVLNFIIKDIEQIQQIIPSPEIRDIYLEKFELETINTTTNKMYKLFIGQYLEKDKVEIIEGTEVYTQITYVSMGDVVVLEEEYIEGEFERDDELEPAPDPTPLPRWIMDLEPYFNKIVIVAVGFVALLTLPRIINYVVPVSTSGYYKKNKRQNRRNKIIILVIVALVVLLLFI